MKLVVITQYQESKSVRWANKGGEVYVVENITFNQRQSIQRFGIPYLHDLLEHDMDVTMEQIADEEYCRRFIKGFWLVEDDTDLVEAGFIEEWEQKDVFTLAYSKKLKAWTANRFVKADFWWKNAPSGRPYEGYFEGFALAPKGERVDGSYNKHYVEVAA